MDKQLLIPPMGMICFTIYNVLYDITPILICKKGYECKCKHERLSNITLYTNIGK